MTYIEVCLKNPTAGRGDAMPRGESRVLLGDTSEVRGEISAACGDPVMMLERGVWWLVGLWVFFFVPVMALDRDGVGSGCTRRYESSGMWGCKE